MSFQLTVRSLRPLLESLNLFEQLTLLSLRSLPRISEETETPLTSMRLWMTLISDEL